VTGTVLAPLFRCQSPALRRLVLLDVPRVPLASIARGCRLRTLMLRGSLASESVEALSHCSELRVLKLALEPKAPQDAFIRVFTSCRELRVVDIYGATDVSDALLGCAMLNLRSLEEFVASHSGGGFSGALSEPMADAFRLHFADARVFIDNLVKNSLL